MRHRLVPSTWRFGDGSPILESVDFYPADPSARKNRPFIGTRVAPRIEALDGRLLLSAAGAPALPVPSATEVASASVTLNALNPGAFSQFQIDLAKAEGQSRVTLADARKLVRDEKIIDPTIESGNLGPTTTSAVVNAVQTDVDNAFLQSALPASSSAQEQQGLSELLAQADPGQHFSSFFVRDVVNEMKAVARAAAGKSGATDTAAADQATLANDLSQTSDASLGSGAAGLNALQVYYNGQVNKFVK